MGRFTKRSETKRFDQTTRRRFHRMQRHKPDIALIRPSCSGLVGDDGGGVSASRAPRIAISEAQVGISRRPDPWGTRDASAKLFLHQRRPGGREGEAAAITHPAGEPDAANDWMLPTPTLDDTGALAARRDRAAAVGMFAHLGAITVVAAATIGVFFGIAFVLLEPIAKPTVGQRPLGEPSAVAAMPQGGPP
ncbi:MAG: hypothetical protein ACREEZ_14085, partial [Stellaceae bacterium]